MSPLAVAWKALYGRFQKEPPAPKIPWDETADALRKSGVDERIRRLGLVVWHVLKAPETDGTQTIHLSLSLLSPGRAIDRSELPRRRRRLSALLASRRDELERLLASALDVPADTFVLHEHLIETCCRRDCASCLLNRPEYDDSDWTEPALAPEETSQ